MNQFEETKLLETKSPSTEDMKDIVVEPTKESVKEETKPKKIPKQKCYHCNAKLKMIVFTCKCNHIFCPKHLGAHSHNCTYDYKNEKKKQIEENNPKLESKMERI